MPRPSLSLSDRAKNVRVAYDALATALAYADAGQSDATLTPAQRQSRWDAVEVHGAVIHRQGRLLAGKSKGG
jgi:hypothetical protein